APRPSPWHARRRGRAVFQSPEHSYDLRCEFERTDHRASQQIDLVAIPRERTNTLQRSLRGKLKRSAIGRFTNQRAFGCAHSPGPRADAARREPDRPDHPAIDIEG